VLRRLWKVTLGLLVVLALVWGCGSEEVELDETDTDTDTAPDGYGAIAPGCWVQQITSTDGVVIADQIELPDGSIVIAGSYDEDATFDPSGPNETQLVYDPEKKNGGFLARYLSDGSLSWATSPVTSTGMGAGIESIAPAQDSGVVVAGIFYGDAIFHEGTADEVVLEADMSIDEACCDVFLAKLDVNGDLVWARRDGGPDVANVRGVEVLTNGSILTVGPLQETMIFDEGEANETQLEETAEAQNYFAMFDSDGAFLSAVTEGRFGMGPGSTIIAALDDGGFAIKGTYDGEGAVLGLGQANETAWPGADDGMSESGFLARYSAEGELQWAGRVEVAPGDDAQPAWAWPGAVVTLDDDGVAVVGALRGEAEVHGIEESIDLSAGGGDEGFGAFAARYSASGEVEWAWASENGPGVTQDVGGAVLASGGLALAGTLEGAITFDPDDPEGSTLSAPSAAGAKQHFVAAFTGDGAVDWVARTADGLQQEAFWTGSSVTGLSDGSLLLSGWFQGDAEFEVGGDSVLLTSVGDNDGFLLNVCP